MSSPTPIDLINELKWRGLFHQCTDEAALRQHLADPAKHQRSAYVGYDPTADSLTIGNLVTIMLLVHFWRAGHIPVAIVGGGTGMIGDPSGKSAERQLLTMEQVNKNINGQRPIFERLFTNAAALEGRPAFTPRLINNADWLMKLGYIEALRDIGKHFSVNEMIKKDSVRMRLEQRDQGISYTEFSYMILQSYDYLVLFRDFAKHGLDRPVTLQMGGSDQWGNIVGGGDLTRKAAPSVAYELRRALFVNAGAPSASHAWQLAFAACTRAKTLLTEHGKRQTSIRFELDDRLGLSQQLDQMISVAESPECSPILAQTVFGLTAPLITKADGGKFGKTESGAIWLTPERTSPYAYHQFWLNSADADMGKFLRIFTLLPKEKIESIESEHAKDPSQRLAQRELADAATALLHGTSAVEQAKLAAKALFSGDIASLPESALREVLAEVPSSTHPRASLDAPGGIPLIDLLVQTSLAKSKSEARQALSENSVSVNGKKVDAKHMLTPADLLHGSLIALRRGKKNWHLTKWS